jgi:hypothetical protein
MILLVLWRDCERVERVTPAWPALCGQCRAGGAIKPLLSA